MDRLTTADSASEDWSWAHMYPKTRVECVSGHAFVAHSKFSGRFVAIISREPCPVCANYALRSVHSGRESQTLTSKDTGDAKEVS